MNVTARHRGFVVAAMVTAALVGSAWTFHEWLLVRAAQWLDVGERPRECDYVLVLPGGEETRPFVAAAIVKAGLATTALVPRTVLTPNATDGTDKTAHEIDCEVLTRRGVPSSDVRLIGKGSTSTYTDAQALAEFLEHRPPAVIAVVTNDFHTRRSRWVFRRVLRQRADHLYFVSAPNDRFDQQTWWHCKEGAWACLSEYGKLAMYFCLYGDAAVRIGLVTAAMLIAALGVRWRWRRSRTGTGVARGS